MRGMGQIKTVYKNAEFMWQDDWKMLLYMETVSIQRTPLAFLKWDKILYLILRPNLIIIQNVICILIPILELSVQYKTTTKKVCTNNASLFIYLWLSYKKGKER